MSNNSSNLPTRYTGGPSAGAAEEPATEAGTPVWVPCTRCRGRTGYTHCRECGGQGGSYEIPAPRRPYAPASEARVLDEGEHKWKFIEGRLMVCRGGHRADEPCRWAEKAVAWDARRDRVPPAMVNQPEEPHERHYRPAFRAGTRLVCDEDTGAEPLEQRTQEPGDWVVAEENETATLCRVAAYFGFTVEPAHAAGAWREHSVRWGAIWLNLEGTPDLEVWAYMSAFLREARAWEHPPRPGFPPAPHTPRLRRVGSQWVTRCPCGWGSRCYDTARGALDAADEHLEERAPFRPTGTRRLDR